jgi:hypothetical protein
MMIGFEGIKNRNNLYRRGVLRLNPPPCAPTSKNMIAIIARITIIAPNNTPDASRKICAPLGVTFCLRTPPTHPVGSAQQGGYLFGGACALH